MSDVMWFNREPGREAAVSSEEEVPAVLFGGGTPDWIRVPAELGGGEARVLGESLVTCPIHKTHDVRCLRLEGDLAVIECDQFYWLKMKGNE